jgi:single-strand DNA-binding protein
MGVGRAGNPPANFHAGLSMNSFTLTAVGVLARNPELVARGTTAYTRLCLVGNDYAGKDEEGAAREVVTSLWFVAFGALGEAIARHSRKGDQLFVEARVRANIWSDKQGEKQNDQTYVVTGFRFGAPGRTRQQSLSRPAPADQPSAPTDANA